MKLTEIRVETLTPTGQYASEKISIAALIEEGEDVLVLRKELLGLCRGEVPAAKKEEVVIAEPFKKPKKVKPKTGVVYNRAIDLHKKLFSTVLTKEFPDWKSNQELAKSVSIKLENEEFLSESGEVCESFLVKLRNAMK